MTTTPRKTTPPRRAGADTAPKGEHERMPRLPHEHDESADSQQPESADHTIGKRAFDDLKAGRVDTDRGPVVDGVYRRTVHSAGAPKRKPRR